MIVSIGLDVSNAYDLIKPFRPERPELVFLELLNRSTSAAMRYE